MKKIFCSLVLSVVALFIVTACVQTPKDSVVTLETSLGAITLKLYNDTPLHRDNFVKRVTDGDYDSVIFHRVIEDFVIQSGDTTSKNAEASVVYGDVENEELIPNEIRPNHIHRKGVLAAARSGNDSNPERESSCFQFYFVKGKVYTLEELTELAGKVAESRHKEFFILGNPKFKEVPFELTDEQIETYTTVGGIPFLDGEYTVFGEILEGMDVLERIISVETDYYDRPTEDILILKATLRKE